MSAKAPPREFVESFEEVYRFIIFLSEQIAAFDPTVQFTSWWRDEALNRAVGGNVKSQHLFGFALDLVADRSREIEDAVNQVGLFAVAERDHLHIQLFPPGTLERRGFFPEQIPV